MLALSPKGTVPVLRLANGEVFEESRDIMRWALAPLSSASWWKPAQSPENLEWLDLNDRVFKQHLDRYKYPERHPGSEREFHRAQALAALLLPLECTIAKTPASMATAIFTSTVAW